MKKLIWILPVFAIFSSCYYRTVRGNGHEATETRKIENFSGVRLLGSMNVQLMKGDQNKVEVQADENLMQYIETYVENDRLVVKLRNNININSHDDIIVKVTTPHLRDIDLMGSGDISSESKFISDDKVNIEVGGSGNVKLDLNAPAVEANVQGSGNIDLAGETKDVKFSTMGSGNINASDLKSENADVSTLGSGDIHLYASVKLDASIVGSGNINYKGGASVSKKITGSGEVNKEGE